MSDEPDTKPFAPPPPPPPVTNNGRIARFVSAARSLVWAQVVFAVIALAFATWAVFGMRDLVSERDRLANRVVELESAVNAQANVPLPVDLPPVPPPEAPYNMLTPTDPIPPGPDANLVMPPPPLSPPGVPEGNVQVRPEGGPPTRDCTGRFASLPRCQRAPPPYNPPDDLTPRGPALGADGQRPERVRDPQDRPPRERPPQDRPYQDRPPQPPRP